MARAQLRQATDGISRLWYLCPGCRASPSGFWHAVPVTGPKAWKWNGSIELPTLDPSVLVRTGEDLDYVCHANVTNGQAVFVNDCSHALRGAHDLLEIGDRDVGCGPDDPCA